MKNHFNQTLEAQNRSSFLLPSILPILVSILFCGLSAKAQRLPKFSETGGTVITNTNGQWVTVNPAQPNNIDLVESRIFKMPKKGSGIVGIEFKLVGADGGTAWYNSGAYNHFANGGRGGEVNYTLNLKNTNTYDKPFLVTFGKKGESTTFNTGFYCSAGGGGSTGMSWLNSEGNNKELAFRWKPWQSWAPGGGLIAGAGGGSGGFATGFQAVNGKSATRNASGNLSTSSAVDLNASGELIDVWGQHIFTIVSGGSGLDNFGSNPAICCTDEQKARQASSVVYNVFDYQYGSGLLESVTWGQKGGKPTVLYTPQGGSPNTNNIGMGGLFYYPVIKAGGRGGSGMAGGGAGSSTTQYFDLVTFSPNNQRVIPTSGAGGTGTAAGGAYPSTGLQAANDGYNDYSPYLDNVSISPRASTNSPKSGYFMYRTIADTEAPVINLTNVTINLGNGKPYPFYTPSTPLTMATLEPYIGQAIGISDNDAIKSITFSETALSCFMAGQTIPVQITVTDFADNSTNGTLMVTVTDTFAPVTTVEQSPNIFDPGLPSRIDVSSGSYTLTAANFPKAYDGCKGSSGVTIHFPPTTFTCADAGQKPVAYYYTDSDGNTSENYTKTFTVIYNETTKLYVDAAATGAGNGLSWTDAFTNLQDAINFGCTNSSNGREIYVAKGTYYPDKGNGITLANRNATFTLPNNSKLYGGFPSGGDVFANRNPTANPTLLSGEIGNTGIRTDNSYHVVTIAGNNTLVEGFTIRDGYANGNTGGGLILQQTEGNLTAAHTTTIRNAKFLNNYATLGGAMYTDYKNIAYSNNLNIQNCLFEGNTADNGGAIYLNNHLITPNIAQNFVNCAFNNNTATTNGAAIYAVANAGVNISNGTFAYNNAGGAGGAIFNQGTCKLHNSILYFDKVAGAPNEIINTGTFQIDYSNVQGSGGSSSWSLAGAQDLGHNIDADPLFYTTSGLSILPLSPSRNGGKNDYNAEPYDIYGGNVRVSQDLIDMGAFEVNSVVYVAAGAPAGGDGNSWATALNNLNDGITAAGTGVLQRDIWLKEGLYFPDRVMGSSTPTPGNRDNTFYLNYTLKIYGGFAGNETSIAQRNIGQHPTILSGDLNTPLNSFDNAYHVITVMAGASRLDGLIIEGGNANHATDADKQRGGGVFEYAEYAGAKNEVVNCVFRNNHATENGGAWYVRTNNEGITNFVQSIFYANTAARGAVSFIKMNNVNANAYEQNYYNATALGNVSSVSGAGIFEASEISTSRPARINFYNALLTGNLPQNYNDAGNTGHIILKNAYIAATNTGVFVNPSNPAGADGKIMTADDGIQLNSSSLAVNYGDNALAYSGIEKDAAGKSRIANNIDAGAYESMYAAPFIPDANGIIYVKLNATGNGTSWTNATGDLHNAVQAAGVQKVYVAIGNYKVGANSFVMRNGVAIYGGFDPDHGITDLSHQRIMPNAANLTQGSVLDGENTRPVIWNVFTSATALNNTAVLDGFAITNGAYADGAGMRNVYASPTLVNLIIVRNSATASGAGIYNNNSSPLLVNSIVNNNNIVNLQTGITINGAGVSNTASSAPVLTNVNLTGNFLLAPLGIVKGAGMYSNNSSPKVYNSIIWNNQKMNNPAVPGADMENEGTGTLTLKNSITQLYNTGNTADNNKINTNPQFVSESVADYRLSKGSPAVDAGDNSLYTGLDATVKDLAGNLRLKGTHVDLGAYEFSLVPNNASGIVYVRQTTTGNGNGSSWDNATANLQEAINSGAAKVFVATGNYPVGASSFIMKNNVAIYGGFDPDKGITDLSHNRILPDKGMGDGSVLNGENTRPVIWNDNNGLTTTAILDGFTITGGKGNTGGGIYNNAVSPAFNHLVIKENASTVGYGDGGGIYLTNNASPTITDVIIKNNTCSRDGGGIFGLNSAPVLTNVQVLDNATTHLMGVGGGLAFYAAGSQPILNNVVVKGNSAGKGGGIYNDTYVIMTINNGLIADNITSTGRGISGISQTDNSHLRLNNVTIANNVISQWSTCSLTAKNSIIYADISGGTFTAYNSLMLNNSNTANGNLYSVGMAPSDIFTSPPTGDYTLKRTSPAINAGSNTLYTGLDASTKDLKAAARVYNYGNGGVIDLGAYESPYETPAFGPDGQGIIYVTKYGNGSESGNSWNNATSSLRRAIHSTGVQQVWVASGNYEMDGISLIMKNGVAIYGGFDPNRNIKTLNDTRVSPGVDVNNEGSVLDGLNERPVIWNNYTLINPLNHTAKLDGFIIKNGKTASGAGIYNNYASPTLTNLLIKDNVADNDGSGIYNVNSSSPIMDNVTVSNNKANYGAGMMNRNASSPVMTHVTLKENKATNDGGAMYNDAAATPVLTNVIITGNTAVNGAGLYNRTNSSPVLTNAQLTGNTATANGGAIRNEGNSSPLLTNVTIAGNTASNALYSTDGTTSLANSIVYGGITGTYTPQYSIIPGNADFTHGNIDAAGVASEDIFTNPTDGDYTLKSGAPVLNKGNNTLFTGLDANTKDLAGNLRVYNFTSGGLIDMGAYEKLGQGQMIYPIANLVKTYGDAPFELGATATSGLMVSYRSADNAIAEAYQDAADGNKWKIKIKKAGTVNITISQAGNSDFDPAAPVIVGLTINKASTTITWVNPAAIMSGMALSATQLNATADVAGTFAYSPALGTQLNAGAGETLSVTFTPTDAGNYTTATKSVFIDVMDANKTTPVLSWANPSAITYGTALNATQLNATTNVNGTFTYSPALGSMLDVGAAQTLRVTFTPTDASNYNAVTKSVTINVDNATPVLTWVNPAAITYGTALSTTQLNATADVAGIFTYTPALGTQLNTGAGATLSVTFTPTDANNYNAVTKLVTIDVDKATPVLTWANPAAIMHGTALSATQLNAAADVAGTFAYSPALGTQLNAGGGETLSVTFTPTDAVNYTTATKSVIIDVMDINKITPVLSWSAPSTITYGTALNVAQLNATANVNGTFTYSPALGTMLDAGIAQTLSVTFVPTDAGNYNAVTKSVAVNVDKVTPVLTWINPAAITYGTTLSATQLNAAADVVGQFAYTPAPGTSLNAGGSQSLSVTFTPADANNYNPVHKTVTIDVNKAASVITAGAIQTFTYNGAPKSVTATVNHSEIIPTYTPQQSYTNAGEYPVTIHAAATANYLASDKTVTLKINPAVISGVTFANANFTYDGTAKGLAVTGLPTGATVSYTGNGKTGVGRYVITATIGQANYGDLILTAQLTIVKAEISGITFSNANFTYDGTAKSLAVTGLPTGATVSYVGNNQTNAGAYAVTAIISQPNYEDQTLAAQLTIEQRAITITADTKTKAYGTADPMLTYRITKGSLVNGDAFTGVLTRTIGETTGTYTITQNTLTLSNNYNFTYLSGSLTILPSTNANLTNLILSSGTLSPVFDAKIHSYKVSVGNAVNQLSLTPILSDATAIVRINGSIVANGSPSYSIPLNVGDNAITVLITAQDGVTKNTYMVVVYRGVTPFTNAVNNILTPNGDGKNDVWVIQDIQLYPNNTVAVYDRAGRVVYTNHGYNNDWSGTLNGVPLVEATYYYVVDLGTGLRPLKGFITLIREY